MLHPMPWNLLEASLGPKASQWHWGFATGGTLNSLDVSSQTRLLMRRIWLGTTQIAD
jgi:hypothetical protein